MFRKQKVAEVEIILHGLYRKLKRAYVCKSVAARPQVKPGCGWGKGFVRRSVLSGVDRARPQTEPG